MRRYFRLSGRDVLSRCTFLSRYARADLGLFRFEDSARSLFDFYLHEKLIDGDEYNLLMKCAQSGLLFPSMRSIQFQPIGFCSKNERMFNCTGILIDKIDSIVHTYYLLLCGCGVGFNICRKHVEKLPALVDKIDVNNKRTVVVEDSVYGWALAADALLSSYVRGNSLSGCCVTFDYSQITPKGVRLRSCGKPAPGPEPLRAALESVREYLQKLINSRRTRLRPIDVYDIICMLATSVMAGGVRRSALIAVFDVEDDEMRNAKVGDWFKVYPWRSYSNNSVLISRDWFVSNASVDFYRGILQTCLEYGEPGVVHLLDEDHVVNPCAEIVFRPMIDGKSTYQVCNLVEVCVGDRSDFLTLRGEESVIAASILGTVQYAFSKFWCSEAEQLMKSEPLIGLSLTGLSSLFDWVDGQWLLSRSALSKINEYARLAVEVNMTKSYNLGLKPATRVTCVKPSGTVSCIAGCSAGIHPWYSKYYIRNIGVRVGEPAYELYRRLIGWDGFEHPLDKSSRIIGFPIEASNDCVWDRMKAVNMLDLIWNIYQRWIQPGHNKNKLSNAVSCTVLYDKSEINDLAERIYMMNKQSLSDSGVFALVGVSFLPRTSQFYGLTMPFVPCDLDVNDDRSKLFKRLQGSLNNITHATFEAEYKNAIHACSDWYGMDAPGAVAACDNEFCVLEQR